jgi:hypothetical protein
VAQALGVGALFVMTVLMIAAAGSTLDSTFASLSKVVAQELPAVAGRQPPASALRYGTVAMIAIAVFGNLPMIAGAEILAATTLSGTMVMGLAPVFLLQRWVGLFAVELPSELLAGACCWAFCWRWAGFPPRGPSAKASTPCCWASNLYGLY